MEGSMKRQEMAQKLTYLVCEYVDIHPPEDQFPHYSVGLRRLNAFKIIEELEKFGMYPPALEHYGWCYECGCGVEHGWEEDDV
jgi:hypothetical protein